MANDTSPIDRSPALFGRVRGGLSVERTRQIILGVVARLRERSAATRRQVTPIAGEPEWCWSSAWVPA